MASWGPPGPNDPKVFIPVRFFLWSGVAALCWSGALWIATSIR